MFYDFSGDGHRFFSAFLKTLRRSPSALWPRGGSARRSCPCLGTGRPCLGSCALVSAQGDRVSAHGRSSASAPTRARGHQHKAALVSAQGDRVSAHAPLFSTGLVGEARCCRHGSCVLVGLDFGSSRDKSLCLNRATSASAPAHGRRRVGGVGPRQEEARSEAETRAGLQSRSSLENGSSLSQLGTPFDWLSLVALEVPMRSVGR